MLVITDASIVNVTVRGMMVIKPFSRTYPSLFVLLLIVLLSLSVSADPLPVPTYPPEDLTQGFPLPTIVYLDEISVPLSEAARSAIATAAARWMLDRPVNNTFYVTNIEPFPNGALISVTSADLFGPWDEESDTPITLDNITGMVLVQFNGRWQAALDTDPTAAVLAQYVPETVLSPQARHELFPEGGYQVAAIGARQAYNGYKFPWNKNVNPFHVTQGWHGSSLNGDAVWARKALDFARVGGGGFDVLAPADSTVTSVCKSANQGFVILKTNGTNERIALVHIQPSTLKVQVGQVVTQGTKLGRAVEGTTAKENCGRSAGTHIHVGFREIPFTMDGVTFSSGNVHAGEHLNSTNPPVSVPWVEWGSPGVAGELVGTLESLDWIGCGQNAKTHDMYIYLTRSSGYGYPTTYFRYKVSASGIGLLSQQSIDPNPDWQKKVWQPFVDGFWTVTGQGTYQQCMYVNNLDGKGNFLPNVTYTARASLNSWPDPNWPGNGCYEASGHYGLCDTQSRVATQLLNNRSFEDDMASSWTIANATRDKRVTKPAKSLTGSSALKLVGSANEKTSFTQDITHNINTLSAGDYLDFIGWFKSGAAAPKVKIILKVWYGGSTATKVNLVTFKTPSESYTDLRASYMLIGTPSKVQISIKNKTKLGTVFVDELSLTAADVSLRMHHDVMLSLPQGPDGFRDSH